MDNTGYAKIRFYERAGRHILQCVRPRGGVRCGVLTALSRYVTPCGPINNLPICRELVSVFIFEVEKHNYSLRYRIYLPTISLMLILRLS